MTISRLNPSGWATNDPITPAQINGIDVNTTLAPDFTNGGTYAPSATVNVGGSGITLSGTSRLNYASRSITRTLPVTAYFVAGSAQWRGPSSAELIADTFWTPETFTNIANISNERALYSVALPHGQVVTSIIVPCKAAAGHGSVPAGANAPSVTLKYSDFTASTPTTVATASDTSANVGIYESLHQITISGMTHTINNVTRRYFVEITHESGGSYIAGMQFYGCIGIFTVTDQPEV